MNNNSLNTGKNKDFNSLWQTQPISNVNIDVDDIVHRAKRQGIKQRLYIMLDILGLVPIFVLLASDIKLTLFLKWFVALNLIALSLMVFHLVKLRWVAAFGQIENTERYIETLLKQLKNNIKIAQINKHSAWLAIIVALLGVSINGHFYPKATQLDWLEISVTIGGCLAFVIGWMLWAHKRQKRFEKEVKELQQLTA